MTYSSPVNRSVAQPGRALGLGPRRRRFKSCRSDHFLLETESRNQDKLGGGILLASAEIIEIIDQARFHFLALDDGINQTMVEQEFRGLETGG